MFYFREKEMERIRRFANTPEKKAMAVFGRRRVGKTELILEYMRHHGEGQWIYYQCSGYEYSICLKDFLNTLRRAMPEVFLPDAFSSFKDVFLYLFSRPGEEKVIVIDEFPFLCKKDESTAAEFQWIIDHGLGNGKLILLGSNRSFMRHQVSSREAPLYGRFDEILEVKNFTFEEVAQLFSDESDAMKVYTVTGGVAQYVMFMRQASSVHEGMAELFFDTNGRLYQEAQNMLLQELREITTYVSILRSIGGVEKTSGQIAKKCNMDPRSVFPYLNRLEELEILSVSGNPLSRKRQEKRYRISDLLFRFHYTFIEPNTSMIASLGPDSMEYILGEAFSEYLGFVYEDIIRNSCFTMALTGILPFMPSKVGKWWGNVQENGSWRETEIDVVATGQEYVLLGECKYKNKAVGRKELELLQYKASFVPVDGRKICYLLASRSGFTEELRQMRDESVLLIDGFQAIDAE